MILRAPAPGPDETSETTVSVSIASFGTVPVDVPGVPGEALKIGNHETTRSIAR